MSRRSRLHPSVKAGLSWFNLLQLTGLGGLIALITVIGNYYIQGDTVRRHGEWITAQEKKQNETVEKDREARDKLRMDMIENQRKNTEVLLKLDGRLTLGDKQIEIVTKQLEKIGDRLERFHSPTTSKERR